MNTTVRCTVRVLILLVLGGCQSWAWVPAPAPPTEPPPVVLPPPVEPPPDIPPPPPPEEPAPPETIQGILDSIQIGMTPEDVAEAIGSDPIHVPAPAGQPWEVRWFPVIDGKKFLVWAHFSAGARLERKGWAPVERVGDQ